MFLKLVFKNKLLLYKLGFNVLIASIWLVVSECLIKSADRLLSVYNREVLETSWKSKISLKRKEKVSDINHAMR